MADDPLSDVVVIRREYVIRAGGAYPKRDAPGSDRWRDYWGRRDEMV